MISALPSLSPYLKDHKPFNRLFLFLFSSKCVASLSHPIPRSVDVWGCKPSFSNPSSCIRVKSVSLYTLVILYFINM